MAIVLLSGFGFILGGTPGDSRLCCSSVLIRMAVAGHGVACFSRRHASAAHFRLLLGRLPCYLQFLHNVPG